MVPKGMAEKALQNLVEALLASDPSNGVGSGA